ncbi:MAG: hypothetical protein N5P05_002069 [Chroococcopsis gigantea SAG 12.99]|jgi:hypothetical protein|nr:carbohydrate porin [Chlorogloea purpurea SAG 13.99]MDV3000463.1 hypothetical protein [Chroococcopsis gigantea SAG 12.99]
MSKLFWNSLLVSPVILGATLAASVQASDFDSKKLDATSPAFDSTEVAQVQENNKLLDQIEQYGSEGQVNTKDQVTSVNQLRDVEPTAWAFEALRSLVERYGCIVGYPDRTFRGNRAMTRWEFAAGLNACLNTMERLIQDGVAVLREDIDKLKRLMDEFQAELAALGARVDNLESRVSFLEEHQFSTTTKLSGEVIIALTDSFGNNRGSTQAAVQDRVRLTFNSSFTGKDRLATRIAAGSAIPFGINPLGTATTQDGDSLGVRFNELQSPTLRQTFNQAPSTNNSVYVDWLAYYAPIDFGIVKTNVYVAGWGGIWNDFVPTNSPYFNDFGGGNGALSNFASQNPIYDIGYGSGGGVGISLGEYGFLGSTGLYFGYLSPTANNPTQGNGFTNGDYAALVQLNANLFNVLSVGLTYVNSYLGADTPIFQNNSGTSLANLSKSNLTQAYNTGTIPGGGSPTGQTLQNGTPVFNFNQKVVNAYGVSAAMNLGFATISGYGSYASVTLLGVDSAEVWTYGGGIAFPDFFKEGSVLGIFAGVQPYIGGVPTSVTGVKFNNANPVHVEAFYKYQLTDNISVTPGVIWLSQPEQLKSSGNEWIGTLRTTFTF